MEYADCPSRADCTSAAIGNISASCPPQETAIFQRFTLLTTVQKRFNIRQIKFNRK